MIIIVDFVGGILHQQRHTSMGIIVIRTINIIIRIIIIIIIISISCIMITIIIIIIIIMITIIITGLVSIIIIVIGGILHMCHKSVKESGGRRDCWTAGSCCYHC